MDFNLIMFLIICSAITSHYSLKNDKTLGQRIARFVISITVALIFRAAIIDLFTILK